MNFLSISYLSFVLNIIYKLINMAAIIYRIIACVKTCIKPFVPKFAGQTARLCEAGLCGYVQYNTTLFTYVPLQIMYGCSLVSIS